MVLRYGLFYLLFIWMIYAMCQSYFLRLCTLMLQVWWYTGKIFLVSSQFLTMNYYYYYYKRSTWLNPNKLSLNTEKNILSIFHRKRIKLPDIECPINMNNYLLSNMKTHTYQGVILDGKISWSRHIAYLMKKVAKVISIGEVLSTYTMLKFTHPYLI